MPGERFLGETNQLYNQAPSELKKARRSFLSATEPDPQGLHVRSRDVSWAIRQLKTGVVFQKKCCCLEQTEFGLSICVHLGAVLPF